MGYCIFSSSVYKAHTHLSRVSKFNLWHVSSLKFIFSNLRYEWNLSQFTRHENRCLWKEIVAVSQSQQGMFVLEACWRGIFSNWNEEHKVFGCWLCCDTACCWNAMSAMDLYIFNISIMSDLKKILHNCSWKWCWWCESLLLHTFFTLFHD